MQPTAMGNAYLEQSSFPELLQDITDDVGRRLEKVLTTLLIKKLPRKKKKKSMTVFLHPCKSPIMTFQSKNINRKFPEIHTADPACFEMTLSPSPSTSILLKSFIIKTVIIRALNLDFI